MIINSNNKDQDHKINTQLHQNIVLANKISIKAHHKIFNNNK